MGIEETISREVYIGVLADSLNRTGQVSLHFDRTVLSDDLSPEASSEAMLPTQYFDRIKRSKFLDGERRLLLAVLEEAVRSYLKNINCRSMKQWTRFTEVRHWFESHTDSQGLFAFESICDLLEIDPGVFRRRLTSLSRRDLPSRRLRQVTPTAYRRNRALLRQRAESNPLLLSSQAHES